MTATFAPAPVRRSVPTPRVHRPVARQRLAPGVYRRRRRVVGTVAGTVVVALGSLVGPALHDVLAGPGGVPASAAGAQPAPMRVVVTARAGDTMWSIARAHHGEIDVETYLDALIARNGGTALVVGQAVELP